MMDIARFIAAVPFSRRACSGAGMGAAVVLLVLTVPVTGAPSGRDSQRKAPPPTCVAPRFDLDDTVRDPFLPSAVISQNASSGENGAPAEPTPPPVSVKTGPVTDEEVMAAVRVQGIYQVGTQALATVNGNPVQAGATVSLVVRGQSCLMAVVSVDAVAQKVLLKYKNRVFERNLNSSHSSSGGSFRK